MPTNPHLWPIPPLPERARRVERLTSRGDARAALEDAELGRLLVYEGCIEESEERLDDGVAALMQATMKSPPAPEASLDLAWVLAMRGLSAMALPHAKRATELMPNRRDAWVFYGAACADRGDLAQATVAYERASSLPDAAAVDAEILAELRAGKWTRSTAKSGYSFFLGAALERHLEFVGPEEARRYAAFLLQQRLRSEPDDTEAGYSLALLRYELGAFDRAAQHLAAVLARVPSHAEALFLRARIAQKRGDSDLAKAFYRGCLEVAPDHVVANTNLALMLQEEGLYDESYPCLQRALAADPDYGPVVSAMGVWVGKRTGDYDVEVEHQRRAAKLSPDLAHIAFNLCVALLQAGRFDELEIEWKLRKPRFVEQQLNPAYLAIVEALLRPTPSWELLSSVNNLRTMLGGRAMGRALRTLLAHVQRLDRKSQAQAYEEVGLLAGQCDMHEIALRAFSSALLLLGPQSAMGLNVAVTLGQLGRFEEALARAQAVPDGVSRKWTILGNIRVDAGNLEEALNAYRRAIELDRGFLLPIERAVDVCIALKNRAALPVFEAGLDAVADDALGVAVTRAKVAMAWGKPWTVEGTLAPALAASQAPPNGTPSPEPSNRQLAEPDLTVSSRDRRAEAWLLRAEALVACRKWDEADAVLSAGAAVTGVTPNGDWIVLSAEIARLRGEHARSRELLSGLGQQVPALLSLALLDLHQRRTDHARDLLEAAKRSPGEYRHPLGTSRAVADSVCALLALEEEEVSRALERSEEALALDPSSGFIVATRALVLRETENDAKAIETALAGLEVQPGDPDLVSRAVEWLLEDGDLGGADAVLQAQRDALALRSASALASDLGERIARALLAGRGVATASAVESKPDEAWLVALRPTSREWLAVAMNSIDRVAWLRLAVAMYLCKAAEVELVDRLVEPFKRTTRTSGFHDSMRDLADYVSGRKRHPPSLGGIARALRVAASASSPQGNEFERSWSAFVRSRNWPGATTMLSPAFLSSLEVVAATRNAIAHVGDISEGEFKTVFDFMLEKRSPGPFFHALGVRG